MQRTTMPWKPVLVGALVFGLAACGDRGSPEDARESFRTVRWDAAAGATTYRVRGWSGSVLLFDMNTSADSLPWTPSLVRAASAFDTVLVRVQGFDGQDQRQGDVQEIRVRPETSAR